LNNPVRDGLDLGVGEAQLVCEVAVALVGEPGGHVAGAGDFGDLARVFANILIGSKRKRTGAFGVVAGRAACIDDGRDVVSEGDLRRSREAQSGCEQAKYERCARSRNAVRQCFQR